MNMYDHDVHCTSFILQHFVTKNCLCFNHELICDDDFLYSEISDFSYALELMLFLHFVQK